MQAEEKSIETQINGFGLRIKLTGQTLKVMISSKYSGKKYQSNLIYKAQNDIFKFAFGDLEQAFQHIKNELTAKSEMIKISPQGKLQIGTKQKQKVRYLSLKIEQVEQQQSGRLIQVINFYKKDVDALKGNIKEVKENLDEHQANTLKIKQQLKRQIADLKYQLLEAISLKSDVKAIDGKVACLKQQVIKKLVQIENKNQFDAQIAKVKTQFTNLLSRQFRNSEDRLKEVNTRIQNLKKQVKQFGKNSEVQLVRHTELEKQVKRNGEEQLRMFAQTREVQTVLKTRVQEQVQKFKLAEILLNYKFPKMMESRFVPLTVDPKIGRFQAGCFQMKDNNQMFQKLKDNNWRQVVSKEQLPRKGKYYFQVMFHYSSESQAEYVYAFVGIMTQDLRQNQISYNSKQSISYCLGNGQIFENGSSRQVGTPMYSRRGLVTVVIDIDYKKISWYYDHQFQSSTTISKSIMNKKMHAFVQVCFQGTILQFKS